MELFLKFPRILMNATGGATWAAETRFGVTRLAAALTAGGVVVAEPDIATAYLVVSLLNIAAHVSLRDPTVECRNAHVRAKLLILLTASVLSARRLA